MTEPVRLSAAEIAARVRGGDLSAAEVTAAHLARIEAEDARLNAVVWRAGEAAQEAARAIDARRARGETLGPLAGVPVTVKVNVDQAGCPNTNGLRIQKDLIATEDSPVVARLREADAVIVGRTNTPAFSLRWSTRNGLHGETLNPRNAGITPGGSSGGAGAAVAAGLCAIGHGTDIAGSIRYPAYACGVQGLRPSLGRIAAHNASGGDRFVGAQLMAVSGPLARRVADLGLALDVLSAPDPRDPWWTPAPPPQPFERRAVLARAPEGLDVDPAIDAALVRAAEALRDAGWTVEDGACPPLRPAARINAVLWMAETQWAQSEALAREGDPDALHVHRLMAEDAGPLDGDAIMLALRERAGLVRAWAEFFARVPLLLCPVSGMLPFERQADVRSDADFLRIYEAQLTQRALPVMGVPAMSVAAGLAGDRPVGVQLVAGRFREDVLLDAGATLEAAFGAPEIA